MLCLPRVLPDEILFSRLIRYLYLYTISPSNLLIKIYGNRKSSMHPILTTGLSHIMSFAMEKDIQILKHQTLAPLFFHYFPYNKDRLMDAMLSIDNYMVTKLSQFSCLREKEKMPLKFCPECVKSDIKSFGVAYWHRSHCIPGIESCYLHQKQLMSIERPKRSLLGIGLPELVKSEEHQRNSSRESYQLAKYVHNILVKQSNFVTKFCVSSYWQRLRELGYITKADSIRRVKLLSDFCAFTNKLQFESTNLLPRSDSDYKFLTSILYNNHPQHLFKYLIFSYWLSQVTLRKIESIDYKLGKLPYSSKVDMEQECVSMLKNGDSVESIKRNTGKSRTYIVQIAYTHGLESRFSPSKLTPTVRNLIISLAKKGFHRRYIAKKVGVSSGSVEMLISSVDGLVEWRKRCRYESKRRRYKCQILRYRQWFPLRMRKHIKSDCIAAFFWLYNNEKEMLESILPEPKSSKFNLRGYK